LDYEQIFIFRKLVENSLKKVLTNLLARAIMDAYHNEEATMNESDIWARECLRTISNVNDWHPDRIIKLILAYQDVTDEELDEAIERGVQAVERGAE
jgi:hypothetical protein